jgi:hypothetical protein
VSDYDCFYLLRWALAHGYPALQPKPNEQTLVNDLKEEGFLLGPAPLDLGGAGSIAEWILTELIVRYRGHFVGTIFLKRVVSHGGSRIPCTFACSTSIHWARRGRSHQMDLAHRTHCGTTAVQ